MTTGHTAEHGRHPSFKQYVLIAIILFLITIVEFFIIFPKPHITGVPLAVTLIGLSAIKFGIVIMFYMHLKFDAKMFTWVFLGGLALAFAVAVALLGLFGALEIQAQPREFAQKHAVPYTHGETVDDHGNDGGEPKPDGGKMDGGVMPGGGDDAKLALGKSMFTSKGTCLACHTIKGVSNGSIGPDLTHIGVEGGARKPGMGAEAYIRESIENPNAFITPGFPPVMPPNLKANMTKDEYEALVAFLLAQK